MIQVRQLLTLICLVGCMEAQPQGAAAKIDASAIWKVSPQFLAAAPVACPSGNIECLTGQMTKAGASAHAVNFTQDLYKQSHGDFGIMTAFQDQGTLAFAWIIYPLRANTNNGLLLVNGQPLIVDLEDLKLLDTKTMKQSSQFQNVKGQFPNVDLWPGDRDGKTWPTPQAGSNGGTQFVLSYPLRNGCHACARAGDAIFMWNFDAKGKFLGTTFAGMLSPPLN
jgi:hypothetical protein